MNFSLNTKEWDINKEGVTMFEKEAEKHADGIYHYKINVSDYGEDGIINYRYSDVKEAYQKGAEFGYKEGIKTLDDVTRAFNREHKKYTDLRIANEWHDLRKDPNDLPKKVGNYIVCYLDTACERHTFELSFVDYFEDKHWIDEDNHNIEGYDEGVIAWCEIPTFTDKE